MSTRRVAPPLVVEKIISGAQTGADRGALYGALDVGFPIGGFAPYGWRAEDGVIPEELRAHMTQTVSERYDVRTRRNVEESDMTLIVHLGKHGAGTALTARFALKRKKPLWIEDLWTSRQVFSWNGGALVDVAAQPNPPTLRNMLAELKVKTLNVAGPRESHAPGLQARVRAFVAELLRPLIK